jgi:transcriptional regulator with XRE-family HTH domain
MSQTNKKILNRIKSVLAEKGHTNKWLAEQLGKYYTTVSRWCRDEQQPSLETLDEIAKILDLDISELRTRTKRKGKNKDREKEDN